MVEKDKDYLEFTGEQRNNFILGNLHKTIPLNRNLINKDWNADALTKFKQVIMSSHSFLSKNQGLFYNNYLSQQKNPEGYRNYLAITIEYFLNHGKIFGIDESVQELLENTKNKIYYRQSPFNCVYLNQEFTIKENIKIFGTLVIKSKEMIPTTKDIGNKNITSEEGLRFICLGIDYNDNSEFYYEFSILKNSGLIEAGNNSVFSKDIEKEIDNKISLFFCNFIDFINHPNVTYRILEKPLNSNKKSITPRYERTKIIISDKLERYIYNELPIIKSKYGYSFWIRGHFKHFRELRRYIHLYKLNKEELHKRGYQIDNDVIKKWVLPYIKGSGELKKGEYLVK